MVKKSLSNRRKLTIVFVWLLTMLCISTENHGATSLPSQIPAHPMTASPIAPLSATETLTNIPPPSPLSTPTPAFTLLPNSANLFAIHSCIPRHQSETGRVVYVIDGDTIRVQIGNLTYPVRYIGIDAPENTTTEEAFGEQATRRNTELVADKVVTLIKDVSETDRYNRLLRYVITADGKFVNLVLVQEGYARAATYPPDVSCADAFLEAQASAAQNGLGLWGMQAQPTPILTNLPSSSMGDNCDPSYPNLCIAPPPPDLDCQDIPFRRFQVLPPDPHHFDGDKDGIGC